MYNAGMTRKRLAMVSYHTCPLASVEGKETGGMNVYVLELSRELAKKGFIVDIYTRAQDSKQPRVVQIAQRLRLIHVSAGPQQYLAKKTIIPFVPEFVDGMVDFIKKENLSYDILHCHYYLSGVAGLLLMKKLQKDIPLIVTFHTLALMKNLVARDELEREDKTRIDAEVKLVQKADKIVAASESDKEYLVHLYDCPPEKILVVNPGVDTSVFKPINKEKARKAIGAGSIDKLILFVGRIEPLKGIDVLLYAVKILLEKNPGLNICLWIVGGDVSQKRSMWSRELQKLEKLRKTLNIATIVRFVGRQPQKKLPYYYAASDLVVLASHYESFGLTALEAMATGTPVITTNVTGIASLFDEKHQKLITSANNPLELAEKMEHLLIDEKAHQQMSMAVYQRVQDLGWENISEDIITLYNSIEKP